jgi:hypothetical protein
MAFMAEFIVITVGSKGGGGGRYAEDDDVVVVLPPAYSYSPNTSSYRRHRSSMRISIARASHAAIGPISEFASACNAMLYDAAFGIRWRVVIVPVGDNPGTMSSSRS